MGKAKVEKYIFGKQILNLEDLKAVVYDSDLSFKAYLGFLDGCIRLSTGSDKTPTPEFRRGLFLGLMGISEVDETTVSLSDEVESHMRQSTEVMYDDLKILAKKLDEPVVDGKCVRVKGSDVAARAKKSQYCRMPANLSAIVADHKLTAINCRYLDKSSGLSA